MERSELITDADTFSMLRSECDAIFDIEKRLPEQVFRKRFNRYCIFEHGWIGHKSFAAYLSGIAHIFADITVNYMTLEPDPVDYYFKHCGFYGLASFEPTFLTDNYVNVMFRGGGADSFLVRGGDIGVFWGSSLQWGIFCDRISWGLCVMGFSGELQESVMSMVGCMTPRLINDYISNEYRDKPAVASGFLSKFEKNYPDLDRAG